MCKGCSNMTDSAQPDSRPLRTFSMVGYGAVGRPLARGLIRRGVNPLGIAINGDAQPSKEHALSDGRDVFMLSTLPVDVDLLILAVPDDAIQKVAETLADNAITRGISFFDSDQRPVVMHLAGRYGLKPLQALKDLGFLPLAWHPMQSFTLGDSHPEDRFNGIHAGVTAHPDAEPVAFDLARLLGAKALLVPEEERVRYHHACVLVSNFLPVLMELGATRLERIVGSERQAMNALLPLVKGMVRNLEPRGAAEPEQPWGWESFDALSGPVKRGDRAAVLSHLEEWNDPLGKDVYRVLTVAAARLALKAGRMTTEEYQRWEDALFS